MKIQPFSTPTGILVKLTRQCKTLYNVWYSNTLLKRRWSPENKANLNPYAFMSFGMGPRNCVGMRFAMEEMKIALCTIVKQFRFFCVEETPVRKPKWYRQMNICLLTYNHYFVP